MFSPGIPYSDWLRGNRSARQPDTTPVNPTQSPSTRHNSLATYLCEPDAKRILGRVSVGNLVTKYWIVSTVLESFNRLFCKLASVERYSVTTLLKIKRPGYRAAHVYGMLCKRFEMLAARGSRYCRCGKVRGIVFCGIPLRLKRNSEIAQFIFRWSKSMVQVVGG